MTKDKLEKEAEEWLKSNIKTENREGITFNIVPTPVQIYCAGAEPREKQIEELENKYKKLESDFRICEKNADTYYDKLTIAKDLIHQFLIQNPISNWLPKKAEQFLKEIEK